MATEESQYTGLIASKPAVLADRQGEVVSKTEACKLSRGRPGEESGWG